MLVGQGRSSDYWPRVCGSQEIAAGIYLYILRIRCGALEGALEKMTGGWVE